MYKNGNLTKKKQINWNRIILYIGITLRILYMLYTPCNVRIHDLGTIEPGANGHAGYILALLEGHLPESAEAQFYQQPLYYILTAGLAALWKIFVPGLSYDMQVSAGKVVSCMASCSTLLLTDKLGKVCNLQKEGQRILLLFVAFTPTYLLTGGCVAPDALATFFMTVEILYTIYWKKRPNWRNTIMLALAYGLGVMTKISCATIAIYTGALFLKRLWKMRKTKEIVSLIKKYIVFGFLSMLLGLWYSTRKWILFGQPFTYVLDQGPTSSLYISGHSWFSRFGYLDVKNLLDTPYVDLKRDYNAPAYFLKSSLFGEFTFSVPEFFTRIFIGLAGLIVIYMIMAFMWNFKNNRQQYAYDLGLIFITFYVNIIIFNIQFPYTCSMDYRYMNILTVLGGVLMGYYTDAIRKKMRVLLVFGGYAIISSLIYLLVGIQSTVKQI